MKNNFYAIAILLSMLSTGCNLPPFQKCYAERIEVSMPATIERHGVSQNETLMGVVALTNVPDQFPLLKAILTEDPAQRTEAVVWTVPAFQTNGGFIAVAVRAPLRRGDSLSVTSVFEGGGWGRFDLPTGSRIQVSVRADSFVATSAAGVIQVRAVAPLQLRLNLEARNNSNDLIRIRGEASFRYVREKVACD